MKKFQEFLGYWLAMAFVLMALCVVIGLGISGWLMASLYWSKLCSDVNLDSVVFIMATVIAIGHAVAERVKK